MVLLSIPAALLALATLPALALAGPCFGDNTWYHFTRRDCAKLFAQGQSPFHVYMMCTDAQVWANTCKETGTNLSDPWNDKIYQVEVMHGCALSLYQHHHQGGWAYHFGAQYGDTTYVSGTQGVDFSEASSFDCMCVEPDDAPNGRRAEQEEGAQPSKNEGGIRREEISDGQAQRRLAEAREARRLNAARRLEEAEDEEEC